MALSSKAILTEYQTKDYLKISRGVTDYDEVLFGGDGFSGFVDLATDNIESYIANKVRLQEITGLIVDGSGDEFLQLPFFPIVSIQGEDDSTRYTKLQYRDSASSAWTNLFSSEADLTTYLHIDTVHPYQLEILDGETFPYGTKNIKVSYNAGYETIPGDIIRVCLEMVKVMWDESNQGSGRLGMNSRSYSLAGSNTSDGYQDMWPQWSNTLAKYRKLVP